MTSNEVAEACGIYHTQVAKYAKRIGVARGEDGWPQSIVSAINQYRREKRDPRQGQLATGLEVKDGFLCAVRDQGGRIRTLAAIPFTPTLRKKMLLLLVAPKS